MGQTRARYEDLSPCLCFGEQYAAHLVAVGWLENWRAYGKNPTLRRQGIGWLQHFRNRLSGQADEGFYPQGQVEEAFLEKLVELLIDPWEPGRYHGWRDCAFCKRTKSGCNAATLLYKGKTIQMGVSNLFVPGDGFLYVSPSMIAHYIEAHGYAPPIEFREAVMKCPPIPSLQYYHAVVRNGPKEWSDPVY